MRFAKAADRIFSRQGFEVQKCNDANQGLNMATHGDYAAILLDVKMPEMDGLHFLEALRKEKPIVPVILMTGYPSIPNAASADSAGGLRLCDQAVYAGGNLAGRPPSVARRHRTWPARPMWSEPPASDATFHFYREAWYQTNNEGMARVGAVAGSARRRQDRIAPSAANRRSRLPRAAAGRRDHRRPAAAIGALAAVWRGGCSQ